MLAHRSIQESHPSGRALTTNYQKLKDVARIIRETVKAKFIGRPALKPMQKGHSIDELAKSLEWMSDIKGLG